ncbi:MAG: tetratricopeptide repeat protein [Rubripirellula sp.]
MNRVATCPKCKTEYELDEDDIGHLMECECGAALFACHTRSLDVFEMWCRDCAIDHQVRGADVGREVKVDCGHAVCVPSVMLRLPVGNRKLAARANAEWQQQRKTDLSPEPKRHPAPITSPATSPAKGTGAANNAEPDKVTKSKKITSVDRETGTDRSAASPDGDDGTLLRSGSLSHDAFETDAFENMGQRGKAREVVSDVGNEARKTPPAKLNLASTLGVLAVAAFLVAAVVMFLLREPPSQKRANRSKAAEQSEMFNGRQPDRGPELKRSMVIAGDGSDSGSGNLGVSGLPITTVSSVQLGDVTEGGVSGDNRTSGSYRLPAATIYALPTKKEPRDRISVQQSKSTFSSLQSAMEAAFEKYGRVQKLKEQADTSGSPSDVEAYQQAIGRTMGLIEQVHQLAVAKSAKKETATTRYLLAFLYLKAGMLPEAAVMGEAVVRWGEVADPSTKEAGMIALAATQELSDLHWGDAEDLGELRQMEKVAKILQRRWPEESQNDLIWMNIGYLYEAFNQPQHAVRAYENISQSSEQYGAAALASGMAEWNGLRQQQAVTGKMISPDARKRVKQRLAKGLRLVEKDDAGLMVIHVDARLALAQIDLTGGSPEKAEEWLMDAPPALLSSIRVREEDDDESQVLIDEAVARQLYDVLFHARNEQGDAKGATQAIEDLARLVGDSGEEMARRRVSILKSAFKTLKQADEVQKVDFDAAQEMSNRIMGDASAVPTATVLWLGESWAQVGEHMRSGGQRRHDELAEEAAKLAAELFAVAIKRNDFPKDSLQSAQLRRIELLRRSGEVMQSLKQIEDMLANEPNVFTLQIAAAQCLQQVAVEYERSSDLLAAIEGPSGFSPIWGWGKLVTTLHATMYSASGTPRHAEQLALAQYNLFWCRYQLAAQIKDAGEQMRQLAEVEQALSRRVATMDKKSNWYPKYKKLLDQISGST